VVRALRLADGLAAAAVPATSGPEPLSCSYLEILRLCTAFFTPLELPLGLGSDADWLRR